MRNNGLFSALFIEELKSKAALDDNAQGRMATLGQAWHTCSKDNLDELWSSFLKQALGYLEFVPPGGPEEAGVYPLYEDWGFSNCISILYLAPPKAELEDPTVGRFYPAKLLAQLKKRDLNWGILTNGSKWRLYSAKSTRPYEDFVELCLQETLESLDEQEYSLFERFFHRDSFIPAEAETAAEQDEPEKANIEKCRLDNDREASEQVLERKVKAPFLAQVDEVLQYICNGFIFDTPKKGEEYSEEERAEIFESAVKLIYRCLFLFYADSRSLLPSDPAKLELYQRHSIQALCSEAHKFQWGKRHDSENYDLWKHLKGLISAVNEGDPEYGIMGYNGGLFDDEEERFLGAHQLRNDYLSRALYLLAFVEPLPDEPKKEYAIPYEDLEVRHLGELYENILEYTVLLADADRFRRRTKKGVEIVLASQTTKKTGDTLIKKGDVYFGESALERKQTGSYYTPESLVRFLNFKTVYQPLCAIFEEKYRQRFSELLEQAKNGHDAGTRRGAAQSATALVERFVETDLFSFKVCDPAMGSGHFLVDAANQMTGLVIALLAEVPYVEGMELSITSNPNYWRRGITRHCIYGVDLNHLAVNLAKLSLWLNCFASEHQLTFIDHHIRCGNSLIGIRSLDQLNQVPKRKKDKKKKEDHQKVLYDYGVLSGSLKEATQDVAAISHMDEDNSADQKAILDEAMNKLAKLHPLADLYTAYLMDPDITDLEYRMLFEHFDDSKAIKGFLNENLTAKAEAVEAYRHRHCFFHWPLEFPDVFGAEAVGGFSAAVGNPPWDVLQLNTVEFFSSYGMNLKILSRDQIQKTVSNILSTNTFIFNKWDLYLKKFNQQLSYYKQKVVYSCLDIGKIDLYRAFLEQKHQITCKFGYIGTIVPSGFYTDKWAYSVRKLYLYKARINTLLSYENRKPPVFLAVHNSFKFAILTAQKGFITKSFFASFMLNDPKNIDFHEKNALVMKHEMIEQFSPEFLSFFEFESQEQLDTAMVIKSKAPSIGDNAASWSPELFKEFEFNGHQHSLPFLQSGEGLPLAEGKMIWQFDLNYAEWDKSNKTYKTCSPENELSIKTQYSIDENVAINNFKNRSIFSGSEEYDYMFYRIGFRDVASSTNARTAICCIIPPGIFCVETLKTIRPMLNWRIAFVAGVWNSFVFDFYSRLKITYHFNFHDVNTFPLPRIDENDYIGRAIISRTCRLSSYSHVYSMFWRPIFLYEWQTPDFWYPPTAPIDTYGPAHEQEIRKRLRDEVSTLTPEWGPHCGVHDRLPDRRDTGDRAQLRAEIDAYVAHLYGLSRDDFAYILDTFPVLKKKEEKAFGEFMSKRKCLEEYDRLKPLMEETK
jgi:hypothetical protein